MFQTVLAKLYEDRLQVTFTPQEIGDKDAAENLTIVADYDYNIMEKAMVDYEWDFDAMFYGHGLLCTMQWDKDTKTPAPAVWNPMTVVRNPEATSVNGDRLGRGKSRFLYRETRLCRSDLENGNYFDYKSLKPSENYNNTRSPLDEYQRMQAEAAGLSDLQKHGNVEGDNATYPVREGFTRWNGKLYFVTIADKGRRIIRADELSGDRIPIVNRTLFPIP